jgi:hypothetical protein
MKNILLIIGLIFSLVTVNAQDDKKQSRKEKKATKEAAQIEEVKSLLESKMYTFSATQALPSGMRSVNLDGSFSAKIKNDSIFCYLPFYGRAYSASYGSSDGPFTFDLPMENYDMKKSDKGYDIKFDVKNKNDHINFNLKIGVTGSSSLILTSTNRQSISYHGNIEKDRDKR